VSAMYGRTCTPPSGRKCPFCTESALFVEECNFQLLETPKMPLGLSTNAALSAGRAPSDKYSV
jgi:hypothetical protein